MRIRWTIWKERFVEKFRQKHGIGVEEVEEVLRAADHFRKAAKGRVRGEDLYAAYGRTEAGRHVIVFFVFKKPDSALLISARDMSRSERRYYDRKA